GGQEFELVLLSPDDDRVSGVVPAIGFDHVIDAGAEDIGGLTFTFVAPLSADDNDCWHESTSPRSERGMSLLHKSTGSHCHSRQRANAGPNPSAEATPACTPRRPPSARRGDPPRPRPPRLIRPVLVRRDQRAYAEVTHVLRRSGRSLLNVAGAVDFRASPLVGGCSCPPPQRIRPRIPRRAPRCRSPAVPTSSSAPSSTPPPLCWPPTTTTSSSSVWARPPRTCCRPRTSDASPERSSTLRTSPTGRPRASRSCSRPSTTICRPRTRSRPNRRATSTACSSPPGACRTSTSGSSSSSAPATSSPVSRPPTPAARPRP